jgi:Rrf2 family protein
MFQIPAKTQYAIRALVHLAQKGEDSSARIAEAQMISPKYLEGILNQLKSSGIVVAARGRSGGYRLSRDPDSILMSEVVKATEGEVRPVECVDDYNSCILGALCPPRKFWLGLKLAVDSYLGSVSLGDVARDYSKVPAEGAEK